MISDAQLAMMVNDDRFRRDGLMEIYQEAQSTSVDDLIAIALRKYPDCMDGGRRQPIRVYKDPAYRMLMHEGKYQRPAYSIGGYRGEEIFVMPDSTVYPG